MIYRLGAYGDVLHASHLPRLIKEYYKVDKLDFETSIRGYQILQGNPYIDNLTQVSSDKIDRNDLFARWDHCIDTYDYFFNLINTIEEKLCCNEDHYRYYMNSKFRREHCGKTNFYDSGTKACGLPDSYLGTRGEMYYKPEEHQIAKARMAKWKKEYDADWIILIPLSGSSMHKRFQSAKSICMKILDKYPKSLIVLTGDEFCKPDLFEHPRIINKVSKGWNFRTVALMVKYVDFYIGPETGLSCVAHMWDTPALQLLTAATWENHIKGAKNAYWVQSDAYCSPCCKNARNFYYGCPRREELPICVTSFNEDKIMAKVEEAYVARSKATQDATLEQTEVPSVR